MQINKTALLFFGRFTQALIMLVAMRLITTILSADEMGNYYILQSIFNYAGLVFVNPVGMFINRRLFKWRESNQLRLYSSKYSG